MLENRIEQVLRFSQLSFLLFLRAHLLLHQAHFFDECSDLGLLALGAFFETCERILPQVFGSGNLHNVKNVAHLLVILWMECHEFGWQISSKGESSDSHLA